jgi:hypothetical protein
MDGIIFGSTLIDAAAMAADPFQGAARFVEGIFREIRPWFFHSVLIINTVEQLIVQKGDIFGLFSIVEYMCKNDHLYS